MEYQLILGLCVLLLIGIFEVWKFLCAVAVPARHTSIGVEWPCHRIMNLLDGEAMRKPSLIGFRLCKAPQEGAGLYKMHFVNRQRGNQATN